jgi:6-phosphogluconolactonase
MADYDRREFLALSALGMLHVATLPRVVRASRDHELLYVGTYTEGDRADGIYLVDMDTRSGALRLLSAMDGGPNPSFLAIHPNGRVLYAVNETRAGTVTAFGIILDSGALVRGRQQPSGGDAPCYVSVDRVGRTALVANYESGTVATLSLRADGMLGDITQIERHQGKGPNAERQEGPHAHCIVADRSNRYVLAADLGVDRVLLYRVDPTRSTLAHVENGDAVLAPGAGPRHLAFHPLLPLVFVANELNSTITTLRLDVDGGALEVRGSVSTLPAGWNGTNYPADIHVEPLGKALYLSNRGHNSIAVFTIEGSGALTLRQHVPTEGDWPRNFSLDPTGRWLLVANQRSGNIVVFGRDGQTGRLSLTSERLAIPSPVCLRFRAHAGVVT